MATKQDLNREDVRQNILRIYENFYWIHLWIIDVLARWTLKRQDTDGKLNLVQQSWEERNQMEAFKQEILDLGYHWDDLDHESYMFDAMRNRYNNFMTTDDELEVLIGMNLFSEGVFGYTELEQLHKHSPELFPRFPEFCEEEAEHAEGGRQALMAILERQPELREHAATLVEKYRKALLDTASDPNFSAFLMGLIQQGLLGKDVVERAMERFGKVFGELTVAA